MTRTPKPFDSIRNKAASVHKTSALRLPGFLRDEIGLGDLVKKGTRAVGIRPCGGCERRARRLNQLLSFGPRAGRRER